MLVPHLRIGVFGGTFNPIHRCHLTIARQTLERAALDRVLFIPTGDPPHKPTQSLASVQDRLEMVRLAVDAQPFFSVSDIEARRAAKSYSIDTVRLLRAEYGAETELFFIVGLDAFGDVGEWKQASELIREIHFIVVSRPGMTFSGLARMTWLPAMDPERLAGFETGPGDRLDLPLTSQTTLILLRLPPCPISASDIRARLRKGESVANLLPDPVESYILCHELYREDTNRPGSKS